MKHNSMAAFAAWIAVLAILPAGANAQSNTYTYSYNGPALAIFRDSADVITAINMHIPRSIQITKVTVNVEIDYPRPGDLNVFVYSPILTRTKLLERNCGSNGSVNNVTFDDAATAKYSDTCPNVAGSYRPNEPLANFNNQNAWGIWSLAVENNGSDDFIGYLRGFTVTITGPPVTTKPITGPNAVYNAASALNGAIAPGEMVFIQGANLGPATAVTAPAGDLPTTLSGVQVTFDGTPAAIQYVSQNELSVQVPFNLQPGKQSNMVITYNNTTGDSVPLDVATAAPGVYTKNPIGIGVITAINSSGGVNSSTNAAPRGSVVTIYASGLGTVNPPLNAGQRPPSAPLSTTTNPVTAVVDGVSANVLFAGAAPGYPGLYQVNVQVPLGAGSGLRNLVLFAGGANSQIAAGIFIQ